MEDRAYWLGFSQVPNIGPTRFAQLLAAFGSAKDAWNAAEKELITVLKPALTAQFLDFRATFSLAEYEEKLRHKKCWYVTLNDSDYPALLKQATKAPYVLFTKGTFPFNTAENKTTIGVVGTRKITDYGRNVTEMLTRELVDSGCVIVSGLALGVDAVAHHTTIKNGGKTIAVLGCGIDCCSPAENEQLYDKIVESGGCIVSEYGLGMSPTIGSFPSRNRIIAGLSLGVLVTEGAADSGALITAKDALENNRKIFAVPGPVTSSLSKGPYDLIKKGAVVVSSGKEILEELNIKSRKSIRGTKSIKGDNREEQKIIDLLAEQDLHFDDLMRRTKIDSKELGTTLSMMEMKGMIKILRAGFFSLTQQ